MEMEAVVVADAKTDVETHMEIDVETDYGCMAAARCLNNRRNGL